MSAASLGVAVSWGELLWDLFEEGPRLGGCACNVAYHLAVLGQPVQLISRVGRDELGARASGILRDVGVDTRLLQVDEEQATGSVHVDTRGAEPTYSIAQRVAWDRIEISPAGSAALTQASAFIFGTLAQRTPLAHATVQQALSLLPAHCIKVCDLNLRSPFALAPIIVASARAADVVKLNRDEARVISELLGVSNVADWLLEECGVRCVVETRGADGSAAITRSGTELSAGFKILNTGSERGDTVGAGDAFCARLVVGLLRGETMATTCVEANRYAARVASLPGATPARELLTQPW